jgi:hypothetical protein
MCRSLIGPRFYLVLFLVFCGSAPATVFAQSDEIQVYNGGLADKGVFNLTWHNNFTPSGQKAPSFPGGLATNKLLNGVPEWAYGVTEWFEAGLYMPLYSVNSSGGRLDGFKLRALFAVPKADDRKFFYGANFEFSVNSKQWDASRFTSEVRPIIGWHLHPVDIIINPIVDTAYDGIKNLEFVPAGRVAYNFSSMWALAAEEYADFGPVRQFNPRNEQSHQLYAVVDHTSKFVDVEVGVGFGLTDASDKFTVKLILSRDLNKN